MQQNINPYLCQNPIPQIPCANPNAVNINIVQPQAYGSSQGCGYVQDYHPLYQTNQNPNLPLYPMNYNNMIHYPSQVQENGMQGLNQNPYMTQPYGMQSQNPAQNGYSATVNGMPAQMQNGHLMQQEAMQQPNQMQNQGNLGQTIPLQTPQGLAGNNANAYNTTNLIGKTANSEVKNNQANETKSEKESDKEKTITLLTDDYIKSLENYLNDSNPKVRLIAAKDVLERFKEDDSRIDNPSLVALLNKILRDTSPSVRFLGLTTLQLGYSVGNKETVDILKEIQATNKDKLGEDSLLASEILLKLSAPKIKEVK